MRIHGSDLEQRISGLNKQFDEASRLLERLSKLGEEETIADLSLELISFIVALLEEASEDAPNPKAKAAPDNVKTRSAGASIYTGAPAGFLWKPISDSDGKLAVLLPSKLTGHVAGVSVLSPEGKLIERGRNAGVGNGAREHFRFNRAGGAFPPGSILEITLKSGEKQRVIIEQPGRRTEGR